MRTGQAQPSIVWFAGQQLAMNGHSQFQMEVMQSWTRNQRTLFTFGSV